MKKIIMIFSLSLLLFSCGTKDYEKLSREEIAMMTYQAYIFQDDSVNDLINDLYSVLETKSSDEKIQQQIKMWDDLKEYIKNYKRANFSFSNNAYPKLNEAFAKPENGIDAKFRLYLDRDEKTGEKVAKDILTEQPFTGLAVFRTDRGEIKRVTVYKDGLSEEDIMQSEFYYNGNVSIAYYYKNGELYKMRYYRENGEFDHEEKIGG